LALVDARCSVGSFGGDFIASACVSFRPWAREGGAHARGGAEWRARISGIN
jgi:hypothetical protein